MQMDSGSYYSVNTEFRVNDNEFVMPCESFNGQGTIAEHLNGISFSDSNELSNDHFIPLDLPEDNQLSNNEYGSIYESPAPPYGINGMAPSTDNLPIPVREDCSGPLNFRAYFQPSPNATKCAPWAFSESLNKLFVGVKKACPVLFRADIPNDRLHCYRIRAYLIYSDLRDKELVVRCSQHQRTEPMEPSAPMLRYHPKGALYESNDEYHSVVIPLSRSAGSSDIKASYQFMCLSTCTSVKRRVLRLVFVLEYACGKPVGRQSLKVRVCSSPGRDIDIEEGKTVSSEYKEELDCNMQVEHKPIIADQINMNVMPSEPFVIQILGKRNYELIKDILKIFIPEAIDV